MSAPAMNTPSNMELMIKAFFFGSARTFSIAPSISAIISEERALTGGWLSEISASMP